MSDEKQTTAITTTAQKLATLAHKFEALDMAGKELRELVLKDDGTPSHSIRQAAAMQTLRELLTPDIMAPIMALQGCKLGFKTDKDSTGGYGDAVVRDVTIEALGRGGSMTRNRTNIIAAGYYATKEQFAEWLDQRQGRGRWLMIHSVPEVVRGLKMVKDRATGKYSQQEGIIGALVTTEVRWLEGDTWRSEKLTHNIKGDDYAVADSYTGKADRKCGAWLYARITGEHVSAGDASDEIVIPVQGTDAPAEKPRSRMRTAPAETPTGEQKVATPAAEKTAAAETAKTAAKTAEITLAQALEALEARGVPRGWLVKWLKARRTIKADQTLDDVPQDMLIYMYQFPAKVAKVVSTFADAGDNAAAMAAEGEPENQ